MFRYLRIVFSAVFMSTTLFLVGCSGCVSNAGDKVTGAGNGTISSTGAVSGSGTGTVTSQVNGTQSGNQSAGSINITMSNPTDKIVCTTPAGVVTVYNPGQAITGNGRTTCVDTPASAVTGGSTGGTTGSTTTTSATTASPANSY